MGTTPCHAPGAGRGYCLPVKRVLYIAAGKDPGNVCCHRATCRSEIANLIHLKLSFEEFGIGLVPDRNEDAFASEDTLFVIRQVTQTDTCDAGLLRAENLLNGRVPDEINFLVFESFFLHDLRCAQLITPVYYCHTRSIASEKVRFLHGCVTAADHHDLLSFEEEAITGSASRDAEPAQSCVRGRFARNSEPFSGCARGNDQRLRPQHLPVGHDLEGTLT